ncbi:hypothetical protein [Massilia sp. CCM 8734]|uniref:WD40/YVTN/BNR-like repeat-containing protein n=1 Tax=Massilia sp. CCM 8734 TaxID=2609283 RepID=UPI00141EEFBE|nr:hypothetical protein [Massilia sp. CCM 8734]NHZ94803.1 hypothetical protein [Massilia sp. CCM 8734]
MAKKQKYDAALTFMTGCVIEKDYIYLCAELDSLDPEDRYSRVLFFDNQQAQDQWVHLDLPGWTGVSVCVARAGPRRMYCTLSSEGQVRLEYVGGEIIEQIADAGLSTPEADKYGYVSAIREIGQRLYVCGGMGQVYRREHDTWVHADHGLLQSSSSVDLMVARLHAGDLSDIDNLFADTLMLSDINGISETDIYTVGDSGRIFHHDGTAWRAVRCDTDAILLAVCCASADAVWVCGYHGTLLHGNWKEGFAAVGAGDADEIFSSVAVFGDTVYLASESGLFTFNGEHIERLRTGLVPDIADANVLDVHDGVLWSFGFKDLACFDGTTWTRVAFPDNPPLRQGS